MFGLSDTIVTYWDINIHFTFELLNSVLLIRDINLYLYLFNLFCKIQGNVKNTSF